MERENRIPSYQKQIEDIEAILDRGTTTIHKGHKVKKRNPTGEETVIPLSERRRSRLQTGLAILKFRHHGELAPVSRYGYFGKPLPYHMVYKPKPVR